MVWGGLQSTSYRQIPKALYELTQNVASEGRHASQQDSIKINFDPDSATMVSTFGEALTKDNATGGVNVNVAFWKDLAKTSVVMRKLATNVPQANVFTSIPRSNSLDIVDPAAATTTITSTATWAWSSQKWSGADVQHILCGASGKPPRRRIDGDPATALEFTGYNYLRTTDGNLTGHLAMTTLDFSLSYWIYMPTDWDAVRTGGRGGPGNNYSGVGIGTESDYNPALYNELTSGLVNFRLILEAGEMGNQSLSTVVPSHRKFAKWHKVEILRKSGTLYYRFNNHTIKVASNSTNIGAHGSSDHFIIGFYPGTNTSYGGKKEWMNGIKFVCGSNSAVNDLNTLFKICEIKQPTATEFAWDPMWISTTGDAHGFIGNDADVKWVDMGSTKRTKDKDNTTLSTDARKYAIHFNTLRRKLIVSKNPQLNFGTRNWSVSYYVYLTSVPSGSNLYAGFGGVNGSVFMSVGWIGSGKLRLQIGGGFAMDLYTASAALTEANHWYYIEATRVSSTFTIRSKNVTDNGSWSTVTGSSSGSMGNLSSVDFKFGELWGASGYEGLIGYVDEFRLEIA